MGTVNLDDGFLGIQAYEWLDDSTDATLSVNVPAWRRLGSWKLGDVKRGGWAMYAIHDIKRDRTAAYGTDRQHQGLVTITRFDLTTRIVEGTFEFEGEDRNEDGTFRVRNGAFRLRYQAVRPNSRAGSGD